MRKLFVAIFAALFVLAAGVASAYDGLDWDKKKQTISYPDTSPGPVFEIIPERKAFDVGPPRQSKKRWPGWCPFCLGNEWEWVSEMPIAALSDDGWKCPDTRLRQCGESI